jgi:hypothetical protein
LAGFALTLVPLFAQSSQSTRTVTANAAEFRCIHQPTTSGPGTAPRRRILTVNTPGPFQDLLNAGQASVFEEGAEGRGGVMVPGATVAVTVEGAADRRAARESGRA